MKKSSKYILIIWLSVLSMACSEDWLKEEPPHLITTGTLYTTLDGFEAGLNGLYALVRQEREGIESTDNGLVADMLMNGTDDMVTNNNNGFSSIAQEWGVENTPNQSFYYLVFSWLYNTINAANTIINQAEDSDDIDWAGGQGDEQANKNRIIAEAKAIRAWAYRHLTFCWGDVPLSLTESLGSKIKTDWERTPILEVREQMKQDWMFAEKYLDVEPSVAGKISKGAVQHYLSELYLTLGKPDSALIWADKCINTPQYQLITTRYGVKSNQPGVPFMDMFYDGNSNREEGNTEALWVWQWGYEIIGGGASIMRRWHMSRYYSIKVNGVVPLQFTLERGGRGQSRMSLTRWIVDSYEPEDDRGKNYSIRKYFILEKDAGDLLPQGYNYGDTLWLNWSKDIATNSRARADWPFSRKFDSTPESNLTSSYQYNDQVYLRLADTYLLKAEAQFYLGKLNEAAQTINVIRSRSNASPVSAAQINIDFILDERARELVFEEHRRYTLLRTGKWYERVKLYNHNGGDKIAERDTLFPIPQSVVDANLTKVMPQNPGF